MNKEVLKGNKLIADFMGYDSYVFRGHTMFVFEENNHRTLMDLHYHESWDWLMPVLTKIGNETGHELVMHSETSYWNQFGDNALVAEFLGYGYPLQDGIWKAVVKFIKWYNSNN